MKKTSDVLKYYDYEPTERALAGVTAIWGGWLLNPLSNSFATSPALAGMAGLFDEVVWGAALLIVGLAWYIAARQEWFKVTVVFTVLAALIWATIALSILFTAPASTGVVVYGAFAVACLWLLWRVATQQGSSKHEKVD